MNENDYQNQNRWRAGWVTALLLVSGVARAAPVAPALTEEAKSQAQQLVALIDYVAADYPRAVSHGKVALDSEFEEQKGLLKDADELAQALPAAGVEIGKPLHAIQAQVAAVAEGDAVAASILTLRTQLIAAYQVGTAPETTPSHASGAALYQTACAACHGADGRAQTPSSKELTPPPARFDEAERMAKLSPFRAYNAITYGVKGTSMPGYDLLSERERWDLATYLFTLRHPEAEATQGQEALLRAGYQSSPKKLATQTDGDLLALLAERKLSDADAFAALGVLRGDQAYREPVAGDLAAIRRGFAQAAAIYRGGNPGAAKSVLLSTYLDGFEPKEPALRARDAHLVAEVEDAFVQLRGAIEARKPAGEVTQKAARLDALVEKTEQSGPTQGAGQVAFWGSLLIVLREGLEAALLVATLLSLLKKAGRGEDTRAVHTGWTLALGAGVGIWFLSGRLLDGSGANREVFEGSIQLLTAGFLFWASHWLLARSRASKWMVELKQSSAKGASAGKRAVFTLAFLAVFREMFEVVVFYRGLQIETGGQTGMLWAGAAVGAALLSVAVVGFLRVGKKLPIGPFLLACGTLLCILAVVMTGHGVRALQEADWIQLTPVGFQSLPLIGVYNSVEGLVGQALLLVLLVGSAVWSRLAPTRPSGPAPTAPTPGAPTPAAG
jgi:high-affinity iron transporter